jgi:hypothetical protein
LVLRGANQNTAVEVRTIARELKASGGDRVIIITTRYHTRRVEVLWRALAGKNAAEASSATRATIRSTPDTGGAGRATRCRFRANGSACSTRGSDSRSNRDDDELSLRATTINAEVAEPAEQAGLFLRVLRFLR